MLVNSLFFGFFVLQPVDDKALLAALSKKLAPPLVTLLGSEPEIQYVPLRNINLVVQKYPHILSHEVKVRSLLPWFRLGKLRKAWHDVHRKWH